MPEFTGAHVRHPASMNWYLSIRNILKSCTYHDNHTTVRSAKFEKDCGTKMDVNGRWDFVRCQTKKNFGLYVNAPDTPSYSIQACSLHLIELTHGSMNNISALLRAVDNNWMVAITEWWSDLCQQANSLYLMVADKWCPLWVFLGTVDRVIVRLGKFWQQLDRHGNRSTWDASWGGRRSP